MEDAAVISRSYEALGFHVDPHALHREFKRGDGDLTAWLETDLRPYAADLVKRPKVRSLATHSLRTLAPDSGSEVRKLIDKLPGRVERTVESLRAAFTEERIRGPLLIKPVLRSQVVEKFTFSAEGTRALRQQASPAIPIDPVSECLAALADWQKTPLVDTRGYFAHQTQFIDAKDENGSTVRLQDGSFHPIFPGRTRYVGDLVAREFDARLLAIRGDLRWFSSRMNQLSVELRADVLVMQAYEDVSSLNQLIDAIRADVLLHEEFPLRDACCVLTQAYAALSPNPDLSWLPLDESVLATGGLLRTHVRSNRNSVLDHLKQAVKRTQRLYADENKDAENLDDLIGRYRVVLRRNPFDAWVDGKSLRTLIESESTGRIPFTQGEEQLLKELITSASGGSEVLARKLYGAIPVSASTLPTRCKRLREKFPLIGALLESRTQQCQLKVDPEEVRVV
ncbi:hypothetical protein [Stratiformator vulcanicus]|uniref:Uncharacterized protein n=1 Tax=Stratiformator vulcanicus TaxID=2527980 RepID=A0A517QWH3_9PLAN|nr:hypothetical protein [Stratiformator vulcanicus]QDT36025.1 hypothetical protein Pan189_03800 [Stratiformator vulcanicus]